MNLLFRDPHRFKATTFDEAVVKLEKLMEISGPDDWARNMESVSRDLKPEYHEQFIRYLANPSGVESNACMESMAKSNLKTEHPGIDMEQLQTYTLVKSEGNKSYIIVKPVSPKTQFEDVESDDEKVPDKTLTV